MEQITSADGTAICFDRLGGDGPPLMLAHATGFCGSAWEPMLPVLRNHFSCFALDFRAHGRSGEPSTGEYQWGRVSEDLLGVIGEVERDAAGGWYGVGHSMGGAALLISELERPALFESMWMFEPIVMPPAVREISQSMENPLYESAKRRRPSFPSVQAAFDNYASKPPMNSFTAEALSAYLKDGLRENPDGSVSLSCKPENEAEFYLMGSEHTTFDRLGEIKGRVTVARGGVSGFGPAAFATDVVAEMGDAKLVEYESLSHFGPMEDPDRLARDIVSSLLEKTS